MRRNAHGFCLTGTGGYAKIQGEADGEVAIYAIGSGGGTGAIFNFSYGAESKMVGVVEDAVRRMGL